MNFLFINKIKSKKTSNIFLFYVICLIILIIDQVSKVIILYIMPINESINLIPQFLNLTHIRNPGGAFGILSKCESNIRFFIFLIIPSILLLYIFHFYKNFHKLNIKFVFSLAMLFGGAIGNTIDRIRLGEVIDFLDIFINYYHWPAFNIADISITVGTSLLAFYVATDKSYN